MPPARMLKQAMLFVALCLSTYPADAAALKPVGVDSFFVTPNEPAVLRWKVESGQPGGPVEYTIRDYWGQPVASGRTKPGAAATVEVTVKLRRGFYEVDLPTTGQRFGVVSLPAFQGDADPFFCIDSALSWLVRDDEVRQGLIRALRRGGVAMSRERLSWADISPADGKWNWEGSVRNETVRRTHEKHAVEVLEMFHSTTSWAGRVGKYPDDLVGTARAWRQIGRRWESTWGALEVWNEPDISFGAFLPADQYVPLAKTLAYALARQRVNRPLVGGVFAHYNRTFLDNAAQNGLLDCVDAVSFHTYGRAPQMEPLIGNYRSWLRAHGREAMPLWITECGRPWARGPARPPADQDAVSALDITMKAVEARAGGVARHFPFVYPFYEERESNFGMMGRRATPLRSMGAYTQLILSLAHKRYLGDLKCDDPAVKLARVFGDDRQSVAVLYAGQPDVNAKAGIDPPALRIEGIDGRRLQPTETGAVPIPDGLVYVWLDGSKLAGRLRTDSSAMRLWTIGQRPRPQRPEPSPIVLRFQPPPEILQAKSEGYRLLSEKPGKLPLCVRVFNLADQPHELTLELTLSQETARVIGAQTRPVKVPAEKSIDVTWEVDLSAALAASERLQITVTPAGKNAGPLAPLVIDVARKTGVGG